MKNIFSPEVKEEILQRIGSLQNTDTPLWGKMNAAQMLAHCVRPLALAMGEAQAKPAGFLMALLGKLVKKTVLSEKPFKQNLPTDPTFVTTADTFEFSAAQQQLTNTVRRFVEKQDIVADFKHPFFGKLTKEEWGKSQYKHLDHHLSQFAK
ncbi:MAG: DUF1569 domain-containing protein [Chitinophagaceae bacterium]|nr:DUF1569 domain-containing protein [Chitinophagaceae bacterium]